MRRAGNDRKAAKMRKWTLNELGIKYHYTVDLLAGNATSTAKLRGQHTKLNIQDTNKWLH